jgi:hypothetical protein
MGKIGRLEVVTQVLTYVGLIICSWKYLDLLPAIFMTCFYGRKINN